jgi:hypothetical protein
MSLRLETRERKIVRHALETYLSDLRVEIVKTEKYDWRVSMRQEEKALKRVIARLAAA